MTAAAVANVNPRKGAANTRLTERTKRRKNTRNINPTSTAETAAQLTHTHTLSYTAAKGQAQSEVFRIRVTQFPVV